MANETAQRFSYSCDEARRLVRVTAREPLTAADLVAIIDRQRHEGSWVFGILYDLRRVEGATSKEDAAAVADHVRQSVLEHGPRGPVALVTSKSEMLSTGLVYAHGTRQSIQMEVFWDLQEADQWLAARLSPQT